MSTDSNREVVKEIAKCVMSGISGDCWVDDEEIESIIHHQLQKARENWLREEIVKLEGMKPDLSLYTLADKPLVEWDFIEVGEYTKDLSKTYTLQTIIDRYHSELKDITKE